MPNKYLDSVGLAEYTTLIKTALDDKADLDSPALTGTPTAPTPTAGDDSTKVATTEFVQDEVANYLPLTGGSVTGNLTVSGTITGDVTGTASGNLPLSGGTLTGNLFTGGDISRTTDTSRLSLNGGNGIDSGAYLNLYGKSHSTYAGLFSLSAYDGTTKKQLQGKIDGTLTWDNKNVERVYASGTNYIRYESGLQICWGNHISFNTSGTAINLPVAFKDTTYGLVTVGKGLTSSTNCAITKLSGKTTTTFTVVAVATSNISTFTSGNIDYVAIGLWK